MAASVRCILFIVALRLFTTFCGAEIPDVCKIRHIKQVLKDCKELYNQGARTSGDYTISPDGILQFDVYCEQELDGGGWTVFQQRKDGSIDFYRDWTDYKEGFGNACGFWLGNDYLNKLTSDHNQKLKIELTYKEETKYADYSTFWIANEAMNYRLTVAGFSGNVPPGDSFSAHNQTDFSTKDCDNDLSESMHCAQLYPGAWWYTWCHPSNLNGVYGRTAHAEGIVWRDWLGYNISLTSTRMMIKRKT